MSAYFLLLFIFRSTPPNKHLGMDEILLQTLRDSAQYEPHLRPNFPTKPELVNVTMQLVTVENLDLSQSVSLYLLYILCLISLFSRLHRSFENRDELW